MPNLTERLEEVMQVMQWSRADLVRVSGESSSVVSQWLGKGSKAIKTIGKIEAAMKLANASGYEALWIAKGEGPRHKTSPAGPSTPGQRSFTVANRVMTSEELEHYQATVDPFDFSPPPPGFDEALLAQSKSNIKRNCHAIVAAARTLADSIYGLDDLTREQLAPLLSRLALKPLDSERTIAMVSRTLGVEEHRKQQVPVTVDRRRVIKYEGGVGGQLVGGSAEGVRGTKGRT